MEIEKLKLWLDFGKFFLGTFLIGFISMIVKLGFESRELALKESEQIGQYVEIALREDVGVRKRFAEYFKTVSVTKGYRTRWASYFQIVNQEFEAIQKEVDAYQFKIDSLAQLMDQLKKNAKSLHNPDSIFEEYENHIELWENEKEGLEDELDVEDLDFRGETVLRVKIHSVNPVPAVKRSMLDFFHNNRFLIEEDDEFRQKQSWMTERSTVLFYSMHAKKEARQLAMQLSGLTGQSFHVGRGEELGVPEKEKRTTFFIHYINQ